MALQPCKETCCCVIHVHGLQLRSLAGDTTLIASAYSQEQVVLGILTYMKRYMGLCTSTARKTTLFPSMSRLHGGKGTPLLYIFDYFCESGPCFVKLDSMDLVEASKDSFCPN